MTEAAVRSRADLETEPDVTNAVTPTTVVVVSDDPAVVRPMREAAIRHHEVWNVHVVAHRDAAMARFDELTNVDVLIADVRAGDTSSTDVLEAVRRRSPQTARMALADSSDEDTMFALLGVAHRVVPLPVEAGLLADLIGHVRSAAGNTLREPVRTLVGQVDRLPSPPAMFQRLSQIMESEDWSIDALADEISKDVALTGELLKLVNSSFYATATRITSVHRAISLVGVDLVRYIVLGNQMFRPGSGERTWIDLDRLAARSANVAIGARALAIRERASSDTAALAYLTGVVSEIGLLVLGRVPDVAPAIAQPVNVNTYLGAERAIFGGDRFQVGAHLLMLWGFEQPVIDAVLHQSSEQVPTERELPWFLAVARRLVIGGEFDPHDLACRAGSRHDLDDAIDALCDPIEPAT